MRSFLQGVVECGGTSVSGYTSFLNVTARDAEARPSTARPRYTSGSSKLPRNWLQVGRSESSSSSRVGRYRCKGDRWERKGCCRRGTWNDKGAPEAISKVGRSSLNRILQSRLTSRGKRWAMLWESRDYASSLFTGRHLYSLPRTLGTHCVLCFPL